MLQSGFKEKDQAEVELPGKKHQDVVEFLSCIYPDKLEHVTSDSVYRILPLAVEYQVEVLEKRCHKLLIELVKTKYLTDATQIYRHIQLAELYKLEDLRTLCVSAASDFNLSEMDKASSEHPIPENTVVQIHRLAHRKQELNKMDDNFLAKKKSPMQSARYLSFIEKETDLPTRYSYCLEMMRAARLWYRYYQGKEELLEKIVKSMKGMTVRGDLKEEYELLPETIKQRLDVDFN